MNDHPLPRYRFWGSTKPTGSLEAGTGRPVSAVRAIVEDREAVVRLYAPIDPWGGWWGVSAKEFATLLDELDVDTIRLAINSPGGDTFEGIAIANLLRNHKAKTIAVVEGLAASAASFIAAACDETVMCPNSELMIHDAWGFCVGNATEMAKYAGTLDHVSANVARLYASAAGGTEASWRSAMKDETWYSDAEAVTAGLAQRVAGDDEDVVPADAAGEEVEEGSDTPPEGMESRLRYDLSLFTYAGRAAAPRPAFPASSTGGPATGAPAPLDTTTQEGASAVSFTDEQMTTMRTQLGLPDDADEATILAGLGEALTERADPPPATANVPAGMSLIETDVLDGLRNGATAGLAARDQQLTEARDRTIADAVRTGRISPARVEHWQDSWAADPDGTATTLAALEPGLVPVSELGHDDQTVDRELALATGGTTPGALSELAGGFGLDEEAYR